MDTALEKISKEFEATLVPKAVSRFSSKASTVIKRIISHTLQTLDQRNLEPLYDTLTTDAAEIRRVETLITKAPYFRKDLERDITALRGALKTATLKEGVAIYNALLGLTKKTLDEKGFTITAGVTAEDARNLRGLTNKENQKYIDRIVLVTFDLRQEIINAIVTIAKKYNKTGNITGMQIKGLMKDAVEEFMEQVRSRAVASFARYLYGVKTYHAEDIANMEVQG